MLNRIKTSKVAIGRWHGILLSLGIDEKFLQNKHGPCPICGGKDRYRFDDRGGLGTWICSHCGAGDGLKLLQELFGWSFVQAAKEVDSVVQTAPQISIKKERTEAEKIAEIKRVLSECKVVIKGDPVWLYLNRRTGINTVPSDIRFHPALPHSEGGKHPAMIAIMRNFDGNGASIHRTYLTANGEKANVNAVKKFMQGRALMGSSVWLCKPKGKIGVAEGIETALAASRIFGVPMLAATNAALLEGLIFPCQVEEVLVFADNDANFVGQSAAYRLAARLVRDGIKAEVVIPEKVNTDFADI